ncbi:MAG: hypothetical protein HC778_01330 [Chamaesiphon sp. CSU_1_12]|nr:hypothetical protein [Chamaesiphon sp. CSU_1_12]
MQLTKFFSITLLALVTLPAIVTTHAIAQTAPNITMQSSIDFGTVDVGLDRILQVPIKNIGQTPITNISVKQTFDNTNGTNPLADLGISRSFNSLNPGETKNFRGVCSNLKENLNTNETGKFIVEAGSPPQQIASIPFACKRVPLVNLLVNLKQFKSIAMNVKVAEHPDPEVAKGVNCGIPIDGGSGGVFGKFDLCRFKVKKGARVQIKPTVLSTNDSEFIGFANGTGSLAACQGTATCSVTMSQSSELDANFKPITAPLPADSHEVVVRKLGSGRGSITLTTADGQQAKSSGPRTPQERIIVRRGTKITVNVVTDPQSKFNSMVVSGDDQNARVCNGRKASCEFTLSGNVTIQATIDSLR